MKEGCMRVLCCLDGTNSEPLSHAAALFAGSGAPTYGLLYVIDTEPRKELERVRERHLRHPSGPLAPRQQQMRQAEQSSALDILTERLRFLPDAETIQRAGRPEREIVNCAAEWRAGGSLLLSRADYGAKPEISPRSVGHVSPFVLGHTPRPVFPVRPLAVDQLL